MIRILKDNKAAVIIIATILIAAVALTVSVSVMYGANKMVAADYMTSENLAKSAKVAASGGIGKRNVIDDSPTSVWTAGRRNSCVVLDFGKKVAFNTVVINEKGFDVQKYSLQVSDDGENYATVYSQEHIEMQRLCALRESVEARYLKLNIEESDSAPKIANIAVYNEPRAVTNDFQAVGYCVSNDMLRRYYKAASDGEPSPEELYNVFDGWKFDIYNVVNLIGTLYWDKNADVFYSDFMPEQITGTFDEKQAKYDELFRKTVAAMKSVVGTRKVRFNVCFANPHPNGDCVKSMTGANKNKLSENLSGFIERHGLDGVDIDWEYPISQDDFDAYNAFLQNLKGVLTAKNPDYQLSLAVSMWAFRYTPETIACIDRLQLMGYDILDQNGDHGGFYGTVIQAVGYCLSEGFSKSQINLGIGLYGTYKEGKLEQYSLSGAEEAYEWSRNVYTVNGIPDVVFNGGQTVYDKTAYALLNGLGGIMVWHMTSGGSEPLSAAIGLAIDHYREGGNVND